MKEIDEKKQDNQEGMPAFICQRSVALNNRGF